MANKKTRKSKGGNIMGTNVFSTPAGQAISQIAMNLKTMDPTITFKEAKEQAKSLIKAKETLKYGSGGATKHKLLTHIFGDNLGKQIAKVMTSHEKEEQAASLLSQFENKKKSAEKIPDKDIKEIIKRLDKIDTEIKTLKIVRVANPTPMRASRSSSEPPKPIMTAERQDAHAALAALGFTKGEIEERVRHAPEGASTEEIVKHALKPDAERIPNVEVPAAVEAVKTEMAVPEPAPEAPHKVEPTPVDQSTSNKTEAVAVTRTADQKKKDRADAEARAKILKQLNNIEEKIGKDNLFDTIVKGIIAALAIGGAIGVWIRNHFPNVTKIVTDAIEWVIDAIKKYLHIGGDSNAEKTKKLVQASGRATSRAEAIKLGKPTWYDADKDMSYQVNPNHGVIQRPPVSAQPRPLAHSDIKPVTSTNAVASNKLTAASVEKADLTQSVAATPPNVTVVAPPVQVHAPQQKQSGGENVFVKTRNDEPSAASYIAQLFNHPVSGLGTYKL